MALLALSLMPAIAQIPPPPPPPHTHNWVTTAIPTGTPNAVVSLEKSYLRCGEVVAITVNPPYGGYDKDSCTVGGCPLGGYDYNAVLWTDWSDNGAGGEFGRLNVGVFEICSAANVTHYKAGDTPGTGEIKVKINDVPEDGATGSSADDAEVWSTGGYPFTVYEFDITDTATAWQPKGGSEDNSTSYTARIRPTTDHNGGSMAKVITFTLSSSSEPGYCINFGSESTSDNDLAFTTQTGFNVTSGIYASTSSAQTSATITVSCYDYGAYGTINASIPNPNSGGAPVSARLRRDTIIYEKVYGANIPYDYDDCDFDSGVKGGNHVQDDFLGNSGPGSSHAASDDNEEEAEGAGVDGDGLSRYEEWRGAMLGSGSPTHTRTSPLTKDYFIVDEDELGLGAFPDNLGLTCHLLTDAQVGTGNLTAHNGAQYAARLINENVASKLSETTGSLNASGVNCRICVGNCEYIAQLPPSIHTASEIIEVRIAHELLHAIVRSGYTADHEWDPAASPSEWLNCYMLEPYPLGESDPDQFCNYHTGSWGLH